MTKLLQDETELADFIELLVRENVQSFLEVGSKFGGSLDRIARALPRGSSIVSVDLPWGRGETEQPLRQIVQGLSSAGYDTHLILGDSTSAKVVDIVRNLGPFDACFIDANHTEPYVRKDWANYGNMCRIVAFHDINWKERAQPGKLPIEVPCVWGELKLLHKHAEFINCPRDNGIGVLWRS